MRVALALLTAAILLATGSSEAWADSRDKAKVNGGKSSASAGPAAPVSRPAPPAPAPAPTPRPSPLAAASPAPASAADAQQAVDAGTITTEEARLLAASGADGIVPADVVPPVPTVDPLSQIMPVRRATMPEKRPSTPETAAQTAGHASFFPVPWTILAMLLALSQAVLLLIITQLRRVGAHPPRQVSSAAQPL